MFRGRVASLEEVTQVGDCILMVCAIRVGIRGRWCLDTICSALDRTPNIGWKYERSQQKMEVTCVAV